jgi:hypothetical protein
MSINLRSENSWYQPGNSKYVTTVHYLMDDGSFEVFNYKTDYNRWREWHQSHRVDHIVAKWQPCKRPTMEGDTWSVEYLNPRGWMVYEYYPNIKDLTVHNMLARKNLREVIEADIQKNPVALLERTMKQHDWYYFYSDAPGSYNSGSASAENISQLIKQVEPTVAFDLWMKYCPWAKDDGMTFEKFSHIHKL